jgi:starch-binding outer membrane protein SusE/F
MRTIAKSALLIGALSISFVACKKDKKTVVEEPPVVTPPTSTLPTSLYIAGGFKSGDINAANAQSIGSTDSAGIYYGLINIDSASGSTKTFTINPTKSATGKWGADGATAITTSTGPNFVSSGAVKEGGLDITVPSYGIYVIEVNLNTKKVKAALANWGIIGAATPVGWSTSLPLEFNMTTKKFTTAAAGVALTVEQMKFRKNNDWTFALKPPTADGIYINGDVLAETGGDPNFKILVAGIYDITLDLTSKGKPKANFAKR